MTSERRPTAAPGILLLEQDGALRRILDFALTDEGFAVTAISVTGEVFERVAKHQPDAVVLNIATREDLPLLTRIKDRYGLPMLVMTHLADEDVRLRVIELGADDFMLKPFSIDELASRLRFVLGTPEERLGGLLTLVVAGSRIEIDYRRRLLKRRGKPVVLSRTEWALLAELAEWPGEPRFDGELLVKAFGIEYRLDSAYLQLWMARLQRKLGDDVRKPRVIQRYHGAAYLLVADVSAEETAAS